MPPLRALLEHLDLTLHCGDPDAPFIGVRLAHESFPDAGDLRLAEGSVESCKGLLAPPLAALGYALNSRVRTLPASLLTQARGRCCLFTVPPTLSLKRVQEEALRLLAVENAAALQTATTVQRYLLESLESPKPEREVLERLHNLTGASFILLSPWGSVLARSGASGKKSFGDMTGFTDGIYPLGKDRCLLLRLENENRLQGLLLALGGRELLPLAESARAVLSLSLYRRSAEALGQQALRSALLNEWLSAQGDLNDLLPRLASAGFEAEGAYAAAVAQTGEGQRGRYRLTRELETLKAAGDDYFRTLGLAVLSTVRSDHTLWVFTGAAPEAHMAALHKALETLSPTLRLGVSLAQRQALEVSQAHRQALLALGSLRGGGYSSFSTLDPLYWILQGQPHASLMALRDSIVGSVKTGDSSGKLWRTLKAYLRSPHDLNALAAELHIHVNTLRYRLNKLETLLGQPLSQPETLARLYLAERIEGLLELEPPA